MRRVDLHHVAPALVVDGQRLVSRDLRQCKRKEPASEIRRANPALHGTQQPIPGTDLQMIPFEVTVTFTDERGTFTRTHYRRIVQTAD